MTTATETKPPLVLPTIKLTSNRILVLINVPKETTVGGIILPASSQDEKKNTGTVVAAGPGQFTGEGDNRLPMAVVAGDKVYFSRFAATSDFYEENDVTYSLMKDSDIIGTY